MDARHPVLRPWICSAEVRGNVVTRIRTQQLRQGLMKLFNLGNGLYCVQSGGYLAKFGHRLLLSISAQPDDV